MKKYRKIMLKLCYLIDDESDLNKCGMNDNSLYTIYLIENLILDLQKNMNALEWKTYPQIL